MNDNKNRYVPRGIRNNNPLNIRIGNVWLGEVPNPDDPEFEQFVHMKYGLRAAFVLLRRYIRHYHRDTVSLIVAAWAPSAENKTRDYITAVSNLMAIDSHKKLCYEDKAEICCLIESMAYVETGRHLDMKLIELAYDIA